MSEPEQTQPQAEPQVEDTPTTEAAADANDTPNREAAKYRTKLRDAEAERDRLTGVLDAYRRREAEELAGDAGLARGADLFDTGVNLADLLTDAGAVDPAKVQAAAQATLTERPHWARQAPSMDLGARRHAEPEATWQDVLRPR